VLLRTKGEDLGRFNRLVIESGNAHLPEGGSMSENEEREVLRDENAEDKDEVEAHSFREAHTDRAQEDREVRTDEPDFEAHRKSH
jgi:hypothetical protein